MMSAADALLRELRGDASSSLLVLRGLRGLALPLVAVCALIAACAAARGTGTRLSAPDLRITNQIAGWREDPGSFQRFTPQTLFDIIDGAAPEYNSRGLVEGIRQMLSGPDSTSAEVFVFDFGVPDSARAMLQTRCAAAPERTVVPGLDSASACSSAAIGGCVAYGAFGRFYAEVTVTGVPDRQRAVALAGELVTWYRGRVGVGE